MNKKLLFIIILVFTIISAVIVLVFTHKTEYNKFVLSEDSWNDIISSRSMGTSISFDSIQFNDYSLLIDEDSSIIYYSLVDVSNKYNPWVSYKANEDVSIAVSDSITCDSLEQDDSLRIMLYNDKEYRVYTLVVTKYPILNVTYKEEDSSSRKIDVDVYIFDNYVDSPRRVLSSDGLLKVIEEDREYVFSLRKESLGHNRRENHVSVFGMEKQSEYLIKATDTTNEDARYVQFFINNKYKGVYTFGYSEERRTDNFERNKESNR